MGDVDRAIPDYTKAIEMEPPMNQAQYYFHRGMCWAGQENGESNAIADHTASIGLHDQHPGPFHLRGKLYIGAERWADAEADFDRMLELAPHPEGHALRAVAKHMQGRDARTDVAAANELAGDPGYAARFHQDFA
jgi:tetratricopeptide (TPR) repeat protein